MAGAPGRSNDLFDLVIGGAPIPGVRLMSGVMFRKYLGHGDRIELECLGPKAVGCLRVIGRLLMKGLLGKPAGLHIAIQIALRLALRCGHDVLHQARPKEARWRPVVPGSLSVGVPYEKLDH